VLPAEAKVDLINLVVLLYGAFLVVVFLHEMGHWPTKGIRIKFFPYPSGASMKAKSRLGGLLVNLILIFTVLIFKPQDILLQLIGLVAWLHLIVYLVIGSFNYEPKESEVNMATYVWDDVPNETVVVNLIIAAVVFFVCKDYYLGVMGAIL